MLTTRRLAPLGIVLAFLCAGEGVAWAQFTSDTDWAGTDFIPPNGATIAGSHTNIGLFHVSAGTTVFVADWDGSSFGTMTINANTILIEGSLLGIGAGSLGGLGTMGPQPMGDGLPGEGLGTGGGGQVGNNLGSGGGGGAGYGGPGGVGGTGDRPGGAGGPIYGDAMTISVEMGSGGGAGGAMGQGGFEMYVGGKGGDGGGSITLNAVTSLTITGTVSVDGEDGFNPPLIDWGSGGGGGSGGGLLLNGPSGTITGMLSANGGVGGDRAMTTFSSIGGGGGGGGGRIKINGAISTAGASITATGGAAGLNGAAASPPSQPGIAGTIYTFMIATPTATAIPPSIAFGNVSVGSTGGPTALTILNSGGSNLVIASITLGGSAASMFNMLSVPVLPVTLLPSQMVVIDVEYVPTMQGTHTASILIDSNDPVTPVLVVPLSGSGVLPGFTVTPTILSFGAIVPGTASAPQVFDVANIGTAPTELLNVVTGGPGIAEFSFAGLPAAPMTLPPGASIPVSVNYLPTNAGVDTATVTFTSDDPMNPTVVVMLDGLGAVGDLTPTPPALDLGAWAIGTTSTSQTLTLQNGGTGNVLISGIALTGGSATAFTLTSAPSLPALLTPGSSETIDVTFTPSMLGSHSAFISIASDVPGTPVLNVPLIGVGLAAIFDVSPVSLDFGSVFAGTSSVPEVITLSNPGATMFTVVSVDLGGASPGSFSHDFPPAGIPLAGGGSAQITVIFSPALVGSFDATLTITADAPGAMPTVVSLLGTGISDTPATDGGVTDGGGMVGVDSGTAPMTPPIGGCRCAVGRQAPSPGNGVLLLGAAVGLVLVGRRRRSRGERSRRDRRV